jgi:release factor glutamine methyltransferase
LKINSNKLIDIRSFFNQELSAMYDKLEVDSFYFICINSFSGISRTQFTANPNLSVSESELLKYNFAVKDLKRNKPIQYIIGSTPFADCIIYVNEHVLIPRPETEELVMGIVKQNKFHSPYIIDICTGSGCIAISLKKHIPAATVFGADISVPAIDLANKNACYNNNEVSFFIADALKLTQHADKKYDIIVSNPPYVLLSDKAEMSKNVLDYEPHLALFVDDTDPLLFYKSIANFAANNLENEGLLYFEIHERMGKAMQAMLKEKGFKSVNILNDFSGKQRFAVASLNTNQFFNAESTQ